MYWTEEREEKVKKLWAEGLSASQIAAQLGDVSRNAVIGKVHRLNLASRSKGGRPRAPGAPRASRAKSAASAPASALVQTSTPYVPAAQASAHARAAMVIAPVSLRLTLTELTEHTCKWPIGDPLKDDFSFCGVQATHAYCSYHAKLAYQPVSESRRPKPPAAATTYENA